MASGGADGAGISGPGDRLKAQRLDDVSDRDTDLLRGPDDLLADVDRAVRVFNELSAGYRALHDLGPAVTLFETLTLIQTGKVAAFPCVAADGAFWRPILDNVLGRMHDEETVSPGEVDLALLDEPDAVVAHLAARREPCGAGVD